MIDLSRRQLLAATAMGAAWTALPKFSHAATPLHLAIEKRTLEVKGKAASVFAIRQPDGTQGLRAKAGERFAVRLTNKAGESSLIHWHGQTPPMAQDGVPGIGQDALKDGQSWDYDFPLRSGTHWMHSHHGLQEQLLMAAPLIVREHDKDDVQEAVILLHDFTFKWPEEILNELQKGGGGHSGHGMPAQAPRHGTSGHDHGGHMNQGSMLMGHANDVDYDAYLANDRTLDDPEVVSVEKGGRVRLRIINGATTTGFTIDTGSLAATVLSVDGNAVRPVLGKTFPLSMGQRIDLLVEIPKEGGVFPILALRESAIERTGILLVTKGAAVKKISGEGQTASKLLDLSLEQRLVAVTPLAARKPDRKLVLELGEIMGKYLWTLNGQAYGQNEPLKVKKGERIELTMVNHTTMMHPMHLHGHHFQVVALQGKPVSGPVRDTVIVPSMMGEVTVAFDADNPGRWPLHCHNLFHMAAGMMTTVDYA